MNKHIFIISASLLASACVEDPAEAPADAAPATAPDTIIDLPSSGTANVWTPHGVLPVAYERVGDHVVFQGDMMTSVASFQHAMVDAAELEGILAGNADTVRAATRALGRYRWPGGVIRWHEGPGITAVQRTAFLDAITHWEANTSYTFVELANASGDYIEVIPGGGTNCRADVGRHGGKQELWVDDCDWASLVHELGHAVGLYHEQTRFDRDDFVEIHWEVIQPGREIDFKRYIDHTEIRDGTDAGSYDLTSTMHYGRFAASIDPVGTPGRRPTITTRDAADVIAPSTGLSAGDIRAVERMRSPGGNVTDDGVYVNLWTGQTFTGNVAGFLPGTFTASANQFGAVGDNAASSMYVPPGLGARIWTGTTIFSTSAWINTGSHAQLPSGFDNAVSLLAVERAITFYRDPGQVGAAQSVPLGEWSGSSLSVVGNDAISSLFVPPGLMADLCLNSDGTNCLPVTGGAGDLPSNLDNQISFIRVKGAVTIFAAANMGGARRNLAPGTYTSASFSPIGNNAISSLIVGEGLKATLCDTSTGGGTCEVFRGDVTYVGGTIDNKASWIKIEPNTTP